MKKTFVIIFWILSAAMLFSNTNAVILPFQVQDGINTDIADRLTMILADEISQSPSFTPIRSSDLDNVIKQFGISYNTEFTELKAVEIGQMFGTNTAVFFGNVYRNKRSSRRNEASYELRIRCADTQTGNITFDKKCSATDAEDLELVCTKAVIQIVKNNKSQVVKTDFTEKERNFYQKYIDAVWNIAITDYDEMFYQYKKYKNIGIGMVVPGSIFAGLGFISVLTCCCIPIISVIAIGASVSAVIMVIGIVLSASSAYPFSLSSKTNSVYRKIIGESLRADLILPNNDIQNDKSLSIAMAFQI